MRSTPPSERRVARTLPLVLMLFASSPLVARAATVTVSPHGQEGFLTIQEAIDGVAPGDTIVVGLGVHQTGYTTRFEQGTWRTVMGWIDKPLTFMGDSTNGIIRGPSNTNTWAFFSLGEFDLNYIDLEIEELYGGMSTGVGGNVLVQGCKFDRVTTGTVIGGGNGKLSVVASQFSESRSSCILVSLGARASARDSEFGMESGRSGGTAVLAVNGGHADIEKCTMAYGGFVEANSGGSATIRDSSAENVSGSLFECFGAAASLEVLNVSAQAVPVGNGTPIALNVSQGAITAARLWLRDFWRVARCAQSGTLIVNDSQFSNWTDEYAVHVRGYFSPAAILNMENNYWGTTDLDSIAEAIYDGNDNPEENPFGFVTYLPISMHPLPTAGRSFGSVKSRY